MLAFGKKKKKTCNKEDIKGFLLLFYGRGANHDSEISRRLGKGLTSTLNEITNNKEFVYGVLQPLALRKALAWMPYSPEQQDLVAKAVKKHFGIKLKAIEHRTAALKAICEHWRILRVLDNGSTGYSGADFAKWMGDTDTSHPEPVMGIIEDIRGNECFGYALNLAREGESLNLDFYLNGTYIGTQQANGLRRDVEEKHLGFKYTGFHFTVNLPRQLAHHDHLVLSVFDHETHMPICPARAFPNMGASYALNMVNFTHALEDAAQNSGVEVQHQIDEIKASLPDIQKYAAIPLAAYQTSKHLLNDAVPDSDLTDEGDLDLHVHCHASLQLTEQALHYFQQAVQKNPDAVIFFADHEWMDDSGGITPVFKHSFDYEELLTRATYPRAFAVKSGVFSGDLSPHNLWFKAYEKFGDKAFAHVPHLLFEAKDTCTVTKSEIRDYEQALSNHLKEVSPGASITLNADDTYDGMLENTGQITWPLSPDTPMMAIIIPMRDALELSRNCVKSLQETLQYPDQTEILIIDNGSEEDATKGWLKEINEASNIRVLSYDVPFNWAAINNYASRETSAEYLLFLNNDTVALDKGWDHILRGYLNRGDIGAVGARLLFEDGTIQYGGYVLDTDNIVLKEAYCQSVNQSYMDRAQLPHQTSAIIGAFLACRRNTFEKVGGFDEDNLPVAFNDVDFSLSILKAGLKNMYVPAITFQHLESKSRGYDAQDSAKDIREKKEREKMRAKWGEYLKSDRFYSPQLLKSEPTHTSILKR
ncbi:glycosyltransferase family 2 protein [Kordiimonas sp. SCSIO 12610]|uniref:glycosyltransferase family 2 protein n=1 Tax=Kordiimonas sp. SCSIO 12610 TaxID=2829597 RepID=UPI00210DDCD6|nr:glycosyltransferase family 2 protein [Kordiimonas sp. SCSIO 12610]UTW56268.1 glycosyltransferase family 2 protein [Kordiimonas sp. SCSIO 12610]